MFKIKIYLLKKVQRKSVDFARKMVYSAQKWLKYWQNASDCMRENKKLN